MAILDDTREDWNARPPLWARTSVPWADRVGVSWHWIGPGKGPSASGSHQKCLDQVRDWQAQHQDPNGRIRGTDIGYNALICQHARAIEGRGLTYKGAHSPGVNYVHVGVQFMVGSDTPGGVSAAMLARAVKLRADIGALGKNIHRDWGHRDDPKASTECPGEALYKWVHSGGPLTTLAEPTPAPAPQEDDMPTPQELWRWDGIPSPDKDDTNPSWQPDSYLRETYLLLRTVRADVGALRAVVAALAPGQPLTADEITAAAKAGATAALDEKITDADVSLTVQPTVTP